MDERSLCTVPGIRDGQKKHLHGVRPGRADKWRHNTGLVGKGRAHDKTDGESTQWTAGTVVGIGRVGASQDPPWVATVMAVAIVSTTST